MGWLDGIIDSMDMSLGGLLQLVMARETGGGRGSRDSTELGALEEGLISS